MTLHLEQKYDKMCIIKTAIMVIIIITTITWHWWLDEPPGWQQWPWTSTFPPQIPVIRGLLWGQVWTCEAEPWQCRRQIDHHHHLLGYELCKSVCLKLWLLKWLFLTKRWKTNDSMADFTCGSGLIVCQNASAFLETLGKKFLWNSMAGGTTSRLDLGHLRVNSGFDDLSPPSTSSSSSLLSSFSRHPKVMNNDVTWGVLKGLI